MTRIGVKSGNTFSLTNPRDFYKGASFHYSGEWKIGVHYFADNYVIDFIVIEDCILACKKSHLSSSTNRPINFIRTESGKITGINSEYWDFVLSGFGGNLVLKHGTTEHWNNTHSFVPLAGEIIIYDDYQTVGNIQVPGIKIGDGNAYVQDLPFIDAHLQDLVTNHINNTIVHVTNEERQFWNNKLNVESVQQETLILTRN